MKKHFAAVLAFVFGMIFIAPISSAFAETSVLYLYNDATGTAVAAADEAGEVVWRRFHRPFGFEEEVTGDLQAAVSDDRGFTGHQLDRNSGLLYFGARYYNPYLGIFYGPDPAPVEPGEPFTFNRYAYAHQNPYRFVDPDGRIPLPVVIFAVAGLVFSLENDVSTSITGAFGGVGDLVDTGLAVGDAVADPSLRTIGVAVAAGGLLVLPGDQPGLRAGKAPKGGGGAGPKAGSPGGGGGRHGNFSRPDPAAGERPHTVFRRNRETGRVENYETFDRQGLAGGNKRFRGTGKSHGGVEPPLVLEPRPGHPGGRPHRARPARPEELPLGF